MQSNTDDFYTIFGHVGSPYSTFYLGEMMKAGDSLKMYADVTIAAPKPDTVDKDAVLEMLPFCEKTIKVVAGGLSWGDDDPLIPA